MKPSRDISRLIEIMAALRDPETGCPWDVEQTFETIVPYTIEEAYEVADAIERKDMVDPARRTRRPPPPGRLPFPHGRGSRPFRFGDVVEAITAKMIRRHPHVFGDESVRGKKLAKGMWEKIKAGRKAEKAAKHAEAQKAAGVEKVAHPSLLDDVPRALPALIRAIKLQRKAARVGFDWDTAPPILDKIEEEIGELRAEIASGRSEKAADELGDVIFAVANLARHLKTDPEHALRTTNTKFRTRFAQVEAGLAKQGKTPGEASLEEMEALWQEAKSSS
jgi:ATP diphosphatase